MSVTHAASFARDSRSMDNHGPAGVNTTKLNTEYKLHLKLLKDNKRSFDGKGETDRQKKMKGIRKKDHQYYHLRDNLWNESKFL